MRSSSRRTRSPPNAPRRRPKRSRPRAATSNSRRSSFVFTMRPSRSASAARRSAPSSSRANESLRGPVARAYRARSAATLAGNRSAPVGPSPVRSSNVPPPSASPTRTLRSRFGRGGTPNGSSTSRSIIPDSQRRSSQSQTAIGLTSTPKMERVSTARRMSARERWSPQARMRRAIRSRACTRKAPDPHAGSSTRMVASLSRRRMASAGDTVAGSVRRCRTSPSVPNGCSACSSAASVTRATRSCGV